MNTTIKSVLTMSLVGLAAMSAASIALATANRGPLHTVRISGGQTAARVSVYTGSATACGNPGWYAYESADAGRQKLWTDALLAAVADGRNVEIVGNGVCDVFDVEGVDYIDTLPH